MLTIRHSSPSGRLTGSLLLAATLVPACGGQVGEDATASGFVGTGGQTAGTGGASSSGVVGGTGGTADAGSTEDAGVCDQAAAVRSVCGSTPCCGFCGGSEVKSTDMIDCAIQLGASPTRPYASVFVNCVLLPSATYDYDAGAVPAADGWGIDYTVSPARLVFGAALCEQVRAQGSVPIYVFNPCGIIC